MKAQRRVGVCLDTCHLLASGHDISSTDGYARTFEDFERIVGFDRLKAFHLNDSKRPLGSRVDRHAHIGEGCVGLEAFGGSSTIGASGSADAARDAEVGKPGHRPDHGRSARRQEPEHAARLDQPSLKTSASNRQMLAADFHASSGRPAL